MTQNTCHRTIIENDLKYTLMSPALFDQPGSFDRQSLIDEALFSKLTDSQISVLMQARGQKLGRYFESLIACLLSLSTRYKILEQGLVIKDPERHLGELDFLILDKQSHQIIHLEVAIKFYLWVPLSPSYSSMFQWIGAGLRDFLATKSSRMFNHQLLLSHKYPEQWSQQAKTPDRCEHWVCGRLFVPEGFNAELPIAELPFPINQHVETGYWKESRADAKTLQKADCLGRINASELTQKLPAQRFDPDRESYCYLVSEGWTEKAQTAIQLKADL